MSNDIRIRVKDFYKNAVGESEYVYVTKEVYEALSDTFRKEAHAQTMRDLRHMVLEGYEEGTTEDLMIDTNELLEEQIIKRMEKEVLHNAMQSLTEVQRERLHLYFFEELTIREIAKKQGVTRNAVWKSIQGILAHIRTFFE